MDDDPKPRRDDKRAKKSRKPRIMTQQRLANIALHYLERYASSAENLRRVLQRRIAKSAYAHPDLDTQEAESWLSELIERYTEVGLLNDLTFAEARTRTLLAQGIAPRAIKMKLLQKGVGNDDISAALEMLAVDVGDAELEAACNLARRRRIGPYRDPEKRDTMREKDLATMARAGFGYDMARRVVEAEDAAELEAELEATTYPSEPR